ncbi:cytochrome P450 [Mycobacterium montefiorense]|uniref:Cytochrome P450 hydroxylase n=1 Tax=Mycobacterium montefiorense TaxID=154654 RepID=A0AA37PQQ6_9MYCO|nr:cytochrome P450 [Mycobacterium montefiorense]GBG36184.1 cytochrome P450 hydroxylase [Mycobacterium montefiorense]GKU33047.1 cytochrome P450 hydroxylase [Mycobacterium montefiorense]GKU38483.1 cytochrome P450 hydroxylase [Mycobacterium montefiorense]GKU46751.1 cytochrome P450 hydroxylase [Mycobacterium montefiorense]GKU51477.1 cytochrome P450 hydroxylase [Mycobacterium montefiorense]
MATAQFQSCPSVFDSGLPTLRYGHLTDPDTAHRAIAAARSQSPIAIGSYGAEVLSYELVRTVLRDNRFTTAKGLGLDAQGITSGPLWDRAITNILSLDGVPHHRLRRLVSKAFGPRGAERLRPLIVELITGLVEPHAAAGHVDVVADITRGYPTRVICALLGAPSQDWQLFSDWTDQITKIFEGNAAKDGPAILAAWEELDAYLEELVTRRSASLTDDLISDLIRAEVDGDRLTQHEIVTLCGSLLRAGTDTTRNQLAAAVQALCAQPDQWALLAEHPELAGVAINELMRCYPSVFGNIRRAVEDVDMAGLGIPAGTLVFANTAAANRDPDVYHDPDRLDISRQDPPAILTFGGGVHYCLGVHLARIELMEALRVITQRMPNPRRAGPAPWGAIAGITGPTTLPLEFESVSNGLVREAD